MNNSLLFVKDLFKQFYKKNFIEVPSVDKREFGIGNFEKKIYKRHLSFVSNDLLNMFLRREAPLYISYSAAYYERPSATPMEKKNYLYAELIFDIDGDFSKKGISYAKEQTIKLLEVLKEDFGLKGDIYFSGQRGFHVHIYDKKVLTLSSDDRREIIDYLMLNGLDIFNIEKIGSTKKITAKNINHGQAYRILSYLRTKNNLSSNNFSTVKRFNYQLEKAISKFRIDLDPAVTYDTAKIIRLPLSLHGSTGFRVIKIKNLDLFDLSQAIVFDDSLVSIQLLDDASLPFDEYSHFKKGEKIKVPLYIGVLLFLQKKSLFLNLDS